MKAKLLITVLALFTGLSSHAATYTKYTCHDKTTGKAIAEFGVQPDCSELPLGCAYVVYGNKQVAIGRYKYQEADCPSRSCGNFSLQLKARSTAVTSKWPVEYVTIGISNAGAGVISGTIHFQMALGQAPLLFDVECEQKF